MVLVRLLVLVLAFIWGSPVVSAAESLCRWRPFSGAEAKDAPSRDAPELRQMHSGLGQRSEGDQAKSFCSFSPEGGNGGNIRSLCSFSPEGGNRGNIRSLCSFLPVRRQLPEDADPLRFHRDVVPRGQIPHDAADHLARAADSRRDVAL